MPKRPKGQRGRQEGDITEVWSKKQTTDVEKVHWVVGVRACNWFLGRAPVKKSV